MPMNSITKYQLKDEIKNLENELKLAEKNEHYHQTAADIRNTYNAFVDAGFTEDQAWEIIKIIINNGTMPKHSKF